MHVPFPRKCFFGYSYHRISQPEVRGPISSVRRPEMHGEFCCDPLVGSVAGLYGHAVVRRRRMVLGVADQSDLRARMRLGAAGALQRVGGTRRVSGVSLVALICAAALAPVVAAGIAVGPVVLAGVGVVGSIGANVLTDVVTAAVDRLRRDGKEVSQASVEAELTVRLEEALDGAGDPAVALREAVAALLRGVDAVGAVVEAATARDRELLPAVVEGFAGLGEQFGEFAFVVDDVRRSVWEIEGALRQQQAVLRVEQERAREHDLTLLRVLEAVERGRAAGSERAKGGEDPVWAGCPYLGLVPFEERHAQVFL